MAITKMDEGADVSGMRSCWLFQFVPKTHTANILKDKIDAGEPVPWRISRYGDRIQEGDIVYVWQARKEGGLFGWGEIESRDVIKYHVPGKKGEFEKRLPVRFKQVFSSPIPVEHIKETLTANEVSFPFLRLRQGTNFIVLPEVARILNRIISERESYLIPPDPSEENRQSDAKAIPTDVIIDSESATIHDDSLGKVDRLGRGAFAEALSQLIDRLWKRTKRSPDNSGNSFILNLYGEWGSGKSTLLHMLENALTESDIGAPFRKSLRKPLEFKPKPFGKISAKNRWIVVNFNAWRHQHINPPWWPLMDGIIRKSMSDKRHSLLKRFYLKLSYFLWRLFGGYGLWVLATIIVSGFVLGYSTFEYSAETGWGLPKLVDHGSLDQTAQIVSAYTTIGAGILAVLRFIFVTTASSASLFQRFVSDPMEKIKKQFQKHLKKVDAPLMVFIDDLDRCKEQYVVSLLESMQTLFNDPRVFYTVAADRRWVAACFSTIYDGLDKSVAEVGRPTGFLFMQKIFQLSVKVPYISPVQREKYLEYLLELDKPTPGDDKGPEESADLALAAAFEEFDAFTSETDILEKLSPDMDNPLQNQASPLQTQARASAAILKMVSEEIERSQEHRLMRFSNLFIPNPRGIKLLVTTYGVQVIRALASGVLSYDIDLLDQLVLWTLLSLNYPELSNYLERYPEHLDYLQKDEETDQVPPEIMKLSQEDHIRRILLGKNVKDPETKEPIDLPLEREKLEILVGKRPWVPNSEYA